MNKVYSIIINILILANILLISSIVFTKKRMIIIENPSNSPANYQPAADQLQVGQNSATTSFNFQASIGPDEEKQTSSPSPASQPLLPSSPPALAKGKRINAIFLGIPGKGNNAPNLTDTLMVMSIDEKTKQGFLLSIPRDLLVTIPGTSLYTKVNTLYQKKGIDSVQTILNEITGLNFDYNVVIDLRGVKKIIDQVGGIDVLVEKTIYDPLFPGPNNSYQLFALKSGWQHLDGETALKYIRTRHDPTGDFARMRRQQQVLTALQEKISSLHPVWNLGVVLSIWQTLISHFKTNLTLKNIKNFWEITKEIDLEKIEFKVLDPTTGLLVPGHTILGNQRAYILRPKAGLNNYSEIKNFIKTLLQ